MPIYTTRLHVIPQYNARPHLEPSYSYQHERFCSTLILSADGYRKRFIQGIELRCGSFSGGLSCEPSMIDEEFSCRRRTIGDSYADLRRRLMAKSNLRDDTDMDDNESFEGFSTSFDNPLQISAHL